MASDLTIEKTSNPKPKPVNETLAFGKEFTDHMLVIEWERENGWGKPNIKPYQNLSISPAATGLHYGKKRKTQHNYVTTYVTR